MSELCLECGQVVRPRQQGLQCEPCGGWFHRICGTISSQNGHKPKWPQPKRPQPKRPQTKTATNEDALLKSLEVIAIIIY